VTDQRGAEPDEIGPAVYGFVSGADARAIGGAVVTLAGANGEQVARTGTQADGGYEFHLAAGGSYVLVVSSTALSPDLPPVAARVEVADGPVRHDVALGGPAPDGGPGPDRGELRATVRAGSTGSAVAGAAVLVSAADGTVAGSGTTGADGAFTLADLAPGTYTLTAAGHAPVVQVVRVAPGEALPLRIELGTESSRDSAAGGTPVGN